VTEFASLCAELGDDIRMLGVFDSLPRDDPRLRGFGLRACRVLLPQQRYADALRAMPADSMFRLVVLRWSRWAWSCFTEGGLWRPMTGPRPPASQSPPPASAPPT
jgi:hypothetical protein